MMGGRFSMAVLLQAGFGPGDFKRAGLTAAAIRSLGFSEAAILEGGAGDVPVYMRPPTASSDTAGGAAAPQPPRPATALATGSASLTPRSARPRSAAHRGSRSAAMPT